MVKYVGTWWNDHSIDLVEIDGDVYALYGWNGEKYTSCWKCSGECYTEPSDEEYSVFPEYEEVCEPDCEPEFVVVSYSVYRN